MSSSSYPGGEGIDQLEGSLSAVEQAKLRYLDGVADLRDRSLGLLIRSGSTGVNVHINRVKGMRGKRVEERTVSQSTALLLHRSRPDPGDFGKRKFNERVALWTNLESNAGTVEGLMTVRADRPPKGRDVYRYMYFRVPPINGDFFLTDGAGNAKEAKRIEMAKLGPLIRFDQTDGLHIDVHHSANGQQVLDMDCRSIAVSQAVQSPLLDQTAADIEHLIGMFDDDINHLAEQGWQSKQI